MRLSSLGVSTLIHVLVLALFLVPGTGAARRMAPRPVPSLPVVMALVELHTKKTPVVDHGTVPIPRRTAAPTPRPAPTPKPPKVAARPTPKPSPSEHPEKRIFDELRKYKEYTGMTDEQIRNMPLPPGMKSWGDVLAMTQSLDRLNWSSMPPQLGSQSATASPVFGFFGWAPPGLATTTDFMGGPHREQVDGRWRFAFQYYGTVMVAEWAEGAAAARVAYFPFGGKPDEQHVFDIPVLPTDEELSGQMIGQFTLISLGQPPMPVPGAAMSSSGR